MVEAHRPSANGSRTQNHQRRYRQAKTRATSEAAACSDGNAARLSTGSSEKACADRFEKPTGYPRRFFVNS